MHRGDSQYLHDGTLVNFDGTPVNFLALANENLNKAYTAADLKDKSTEEQNEILKNIEELQKRFSEGKEMLETVKIYGGLDKFDAYLYKQIIVLLEQEPVYKKIEIFDSWNAPDFEKSKSAAAQFCKKIEPILVELVKENFPDYKPLPDLSLIKKLHTKKTILLNIFSVEVHFKLIDSLKRPYKSLGYNRNELNELIIEARKAYERELNSILNNDHLSFVKIIRELFTKYDTFMDLILAINVLSRVGLQCKIEQLNHYFGHKHAEHEVIYNFMIGACNTYLQQNNQAWESYLVEIYHYTNIKENMRMTNSYELKSIDSIHGRKSSFAFHAQPLRRDEKAPDARRDPEPRH